MAKTSQSEQPKTGNSIAKRSLKVAKVVSAEAKVRSGCTKITTSSCGVGYRNG